VNRKADLFTKRIDSNRIDSNRELGCSRIKAITDPEISSRFWATACAKFVNPHRSTFALLVMTSHLSARSVKRVTSTNEITSKMELRSPTNNFL